MKQIGLNFFGSGKEIPQALIGLENGFRVQMTSKEFSEIANRPLTHHLEDIRELDIIEPRYRRTPLFRALETKRGGELATKILKNDEFWSAYTGKYYSQALDVVCIMAETGSGKLVVEEAYKRKDKMSELQFTQVARLAAYSAGKVNEFENHPLFDSDPKWRQEIQGEIQKHLGEYRDDITNKRKELLDQLIDKGLQVEKGQLETYISTLGRGELSFFSHIMFWEERGEKLNLMALKRFIQGQVSILNYHKDGGRLQVFRDYDGQTYLVNTLFDEYAKSWKGILEKRPDIIAPYLADSIADYSDIASYQRKGGPMDQKGIGKRVYSEYVGLSADLGAMMDFPVFLRNKIERLVDNVLYDINSLGYGDHRGYRNNYCFYFVDKRNGMPTTDFENVYSNLSSFKLVVRRIDLDGMKKFGK